VWWIRLGITPERIDPGCPQQNGRHERFHLTLKNETAAPPRISLRAQQQAFARFQHEYNYERPHEALSQQTPAVIYRPSPRPFPSQLPELVYPFQVWQRSISAAGHFSWNRHQIYLSVLLEGQSVALRPIEDGLFEVLFGPVLLGWSKNAALRSLPSNLRRARCANTKRGTHPLLRWIFRFTARVVLVYNRAAEAEDRATLGSDLSAVFSPESVNTASKPAFAPLTALPAATANCKPSIQSKL
jgi:hypothetical protein